MELDIPGLPGSYGLVLTLSAPLDLMIGRLGVCSFPAGNYIYLGSASGPGGLRARLGRHIQGTGKPHWHIDWLRQNAHVDRVFFSTSLERLECTWSQTLARLPEAYIPVVKFGASDCRSGCPAHLVGFPTDIHHSLQERLQNGVKLVHFV